MNRFRNKHVGTDVGTCGGTDAPTHGQAPHGQI